MGKSQQAPASDDQRQTRSLPPWSLFSRVSPEGGASLLTKAPPISLVLHPLSSPSLSNLQATYFSGPLSSEFSWPQDRKEKYLSGGAGKRSAGGWVSPHLWNIRWALTGPLEVSVPNRSPGGGVLYNPLKPSSLA